MARFDPDRMSSAELDLDDPEMVESWLENPVGEALVGDLGRQFRTEPVEVQRAGLLDFIEGTRSSMADVEALLDKGGESPEVRSALQELRAQFREHIDNAEARLRELE